MPAKKPNRRALILDHIGRHVLTIRPVLERVFFEGKSCDNVLQGLMNDGLVQARSRAADDKPTESLPEGRSYYQLTTKAARELGFPAYRCEPLEPRALHKALGLLWFCCMEKQRRSRLEATELEALFLDKLNGDYCLEYHADDKWYVYRVFVAGRNSTDKYLLASVDKDLDAAQRHPELSKLLDSRRYRLVVLVSTEQRRQKLRAILGKRRYNETISVTARTVPAPDTLEQMLQETQ